MKATTKGNLQSLLSMLQLHLWSWKFSRFFTCIHLLPCTLSFTVNNTFVLKVSETQFSLTASYILAFMWHDKRIFFKETPQTKTHVLDYGLLNKIWTPKLKVYRQLSCKIPHKNQLCLVSSNFGCDEAGQI